MIYWINDLLNDPRETPFDIEKDAVIIGRGKYNRDRFLFNISKVNLFFLHHKPPGWAIKWYKKKYPARYRDSLYIAIHGAHLKDFLSTKRYGNFPILTWLGKTLIGVKTNNVSVAMVDYLGQAMQGGRSIYLSAFDMDQHPYIIFQKDKDGKRKWSEVIRDWQPEVNYLKKIFQKNQNIKYRFVTHNRFFEPIYMEPPEIIAKKFSDDEIKENYSKAKEKIEAEPGEVFRKKFRE